MLGYAPVKVNPDPPTPPTPGHVGLYHDIGNSSSPQYGVALFLKNVGH